MQRIVEDDFSALTQSRHFVAFLQSKAHFATVPTGKYVIFTGKEEINYKDNHIVNYLNIKDLNIY